MRHLKMILCLPMLAIIAAISNPVSAHVPKPVKQHAVEVLPAGMTQETADALKKDALLLMVKGMTEVKIPAFNSRLLSAHIPVDPGDLPNPCPYPCPWYVCLFWVC
jgi:hypothetical protein